MDLPDEMTISKLTFDLWWTETYVDRCTRLLPDEIEALVDHHWKKLWEQQKRTYGEKE